jgi:hypothetical protein
MATAEVSINELPVINEINRGDFLIVQTPNATRRLDFIDFVVGLENTTFQNTIEETTANVTSLSDSINAVNIKTNELSTFAVGEILSLTTDTEHLSTTLTNTITSIDSLSARVENNDNSINILSNNINTLSGVFFEPTGAWPDGNTLDDKEATHTLPITINGVNYVFLLSAV